MSNHTIQASFGLDVSPLAAGFKKASALGDAHFNALEQRMARFTSKFAKSTTASFGQGAARTRTVGAFGSGAGRLAGVGLAASAISALDVKPITSQVKELESVLAGAGSGGTATGVASHVESIKKSGTGISAAFSGLASVVEKLALVGIGISAVTGAGVRGQLEIGSALSNLHSQTGLPIASLEKLRLTGLTTDTSLESLAQTVFKMNSNLGTASREGGRAVQSLNLLGLNLHDLMRMKPEERFERIGSAISKLPSILDRASIAESIFGRGSRNLLPLFDSLGKVELGAASGRARVLERDAEMFSQISGQFKVAEQNLQGVFLGIADRAGPALLQLSKTLTNINGVGAGEKIGDWASAALDFGNNFLKSIRTGIAELKAGFIHVQELFATGMAHVFEKLGDVLPGDYGKGARDLARDFYSTASDFAKQRAAVLDDAAMPAQLPSATTARPGRPWLDNHGSLSTHLLQGGSLLGGDNRWDIFGKIARDNDGDMVDIWGNKTGDFSKTWRQYNWAGGITPNGFRFGNALSRGAYGQAGGPGSLSPLAALDLPSDQASRALLSVGERTAAMDHLVAQGDVRPGSFSGAFNVIRNGDRARERQVAHDRLKEQTGLDKTNAKLDQIHSTLKGLADGDGEGGS